jgi:hypothetical protein
MLGIHNRANGRVGRDTVWFGESEGALAGADAGEVRPPEWAELGEAGR